MFYFKDQRRSFNCHVSWDTLYLNRKSILEREIYVHGPGKLEKYSANGIYPTVGKYHFNGKLFSEILLTEKVSN